MHQDAGDWLQKSLKVQRVTTNLKWRVPAASANPFPDCGDVSKVPPKYATTGDYGPPPAPPTHTYLYKYIYIYVYVCILTCTYIYMYIRIFVYICIRIHI